MYDAIGRDFYLPHISNNDYETLSDCISCAKDLQTDISQRKLPLFPRNEALDFDSIGILGLLHKTKNDIKFVIIIKDRFFNLTKVVPIRRSTATIVAKVFCSTLDKQVWNSRSGTNGQ